MTLVLNLFNEHRSTGKQRDAESGLDFFGTRYYGSVLGRFVSVRLQFTGENGMSSRDWITLAPDIAARRWAGGPVRTGRKAGTSTLCGFDEPADSHSGSGARMRRYE